MSCRRCGTDLPQGAAFCSACGAPQAEPTPVAARAGRRWVAPLVVAVLAVAVGTTGGLVLRTWQRTHPGGAARADRLVRPAVSPAAVPWPSPSAVDPAAPAPTPVGLLASPGRPEGYDDLLAGSRVDGPAQAALPGGAGTVPTSQALSDGSPATAWRATGDATGTTFTVRFPGPRTVTVVGLDPGDDTFGRPPQDPSAPPADLWPLYRTVSAATFSFPDGVAYTVTFSNDGPPATVDRPQTALLQAAETVDHLTVTVAGTAPATGFGGADATAISDLVVLGRRLP